ncbi:MAG: hypothetical protein LBB73_01440, partial [Dysgonamonadaceae bacterium]|nr:hypothetical protein [Dysgonamonadaceae bacterium]
MKRTILFTVLCAVTFAPAKAAWSLKYWYCPGAWSEARAYFQIGSEDGKDGKSAIYVGGKGSLPDS